MELWFGHIALCLLLSVVNIALSVPLILLFKTMIHSLTLILGAVLSMLGDTVLILEVMEIIIKTILYLMVSELFTFTKL